MKTKERILLAIVILGLIALIVVERVDIALTLVLGVIAITVFDHVKIIIKKRRP